MIKSTKRIPWPEYDEYEYYDNETSYLNTLVGEWDDDGGSSWSQIAKELNAKFHNNRSVASCKRRAIKIGAI
jgi:hypothetical protein